MHGHQSPRNAQSRLLWYFLKQKTQKTKNKKKNKKKKKKKKNKTKKQKKKKKTKKKKHPNFAHLTVLSKSLLVP
jgi:hypothetical protein